MMKWYEKSSSIYWYDQYALNDAETAFARYDPERIVRELLSLKADIYAIYATNQFNIAYYPSKVIPQHPNLKGHDYLADILPRLREKGKRVILYTNWLDSKHPEWNCMHLNPDGTTTSQRREYPLASWADSTWEEGKVRRIPGGEWQSPCVNSPKRDLVKTIARELVENYEFDGFHLDMFLSQGFCVCEYCLPYLKTIFDKEKLQWEDINEKWSEYIQYKTDRHARLLGEINAILKSRNPNIVTFHNGFSPLAKRASSGLSEKWLPHLDVYVSECFDVWGGGYNDIHSTSLAVKFHQAVRKPSMILLTSTPAEFAHAPISRPKFLMYASSAKVNGAHMFGPCGVGARQDTTSDPRLLRAARDTFLFWKRDKDNFSRMKSAAQVAVIYSFATRSFYGGIAEADVRKPRYQGEFNGWCRALMENHLPFDIQIAEYLDDDLARNYQLLILPNTACTETEFAEVVGKFVEDGGVVLATSEASLYDAKGKKKSDFGLADVLGISYVQPYEERYFYLEDIIAPIIGGGNAQCITAKADILGRLIEADPSGSVHGSMDPMPLDTTPWPLITRNIFGKGKAYYLAWEPGRFLMDTGYWQIKDWMAKLLKGISRSIFTTNAPSTVEMMAWKDDSGKLILKLANRTVPQVYPTTDTHNDLSEVIALHDIEMVFPAKGKKVRASSPQTKVRVIRERNKVKVLLERLETYASVTVEGVC